jgi:hypothetical protein
MRNNEYDANQFLSDRPVQFKPYWQRPPIKVSPLCRPSFILALFTAAVVAGLMC